MSLYPPPKYHSYLGYVQTEKPGRCGWVVSASACQAGGLWFKSAILPLLKHACGESDRLLCWLYTLAEVSHQRWISGNVYHVRLCKVQIRLSTLALKPRGDVTRSLKQGYQWPQKWTCVQQKFKKKKKNVHTEGCACWWEHFYNECKVLSPKN